MSSKNSLQEIFQKRKETLPLYETSFEGGPSHLPEWRSKVTLADGSSFEGPICSTKKEAELKVATLALASLSEALPQEVKLKEKSLLLVDLENEGDFFSTFDNHLFSNLEIVSISSRFAPTPEIPEWTTHLTVESGNRDASDIGIIVYLTSRLLQNSLKRIFLLSHDHFILPIKEIIETNFLHLKSVPQIEIFSDSKHLLNHLKML